MAEPHVVTALVAKRAELSGIIEHHQNMLRVHLIELDNLDATIRLFAPDIELEDIKPKPLPPRNRAFKGEVVRLVLSTLREAREPMSCREVTQHFMATRGMNAADKGLVKTLEKRVASCLRWHAAKGLLRAIKRPGQLQGWGVAR